LTVTCRTRCIAITGAFTFFALFAALGLLAISGRTLAADQAVMLWVHQWMSPGRTAAMLAVTQLGTFLIAGPICLVEGYFYYRSGRRWVAVVLILAVATDPLAIESLKLVFARPRPELWPHLAPSAGFSYPSGHTALATVAYGFSAILLVTRVPTRLAPVVVFGIAATVIALVALSRVYLGVHYPSDVVGAVLFGTGWIFLWWGVLNAIPLAEARSRQRAQTPFGD
jgi:undecaprenyl-diphosphatase